MYWFLFIDLVKWYGLHPKSAQMVLPGECDGETVPVTPDCVVQDLHLRYTTFNLEADLLIQSPVNNCPEEPGDILD